MVTITAELARFTAAGYGTLRIPALVELTAGQRIAVTDDEADTIEAEVLSVHGDRAEVLVHWDHVLRRA